MIASIEPKLPKFPSDKLIWVAICVLVVVIILLVSKCGSPDPIVIYPNPNIDLKKQVASITRQRDSALKLSRKVDTIRLGYVVKWRALKPRVDSVPCPDALNEVIVLTDSIITVDSTEIKLLKNVIQADSSIISTQKHIISNDSVSIVQLTKKAKRYKRQRNFIAGVGFVGWLLAAFK